MLNDFLNNSFKKNALGILLLSLCFFSITKIEKYSRKPKLELSPQDTTIHFNETFVKALSFGQYRLTSSILWAETMLRSDIKHYSQGDLNNWIYRRLNLITTLDPYFYEAYLYGGMYLSIIKDDDLGAKKIYNKALKFYPDDIYLCLNAGYHFQLELFDYPKAIEIYKRIVNHPRVPKHIPRVLARLQSQQGNLEDAYTTLEGLYKTLPDNPAIKEKFQKDLYAIKAELDLKCLNSKNDEICPTTDYYGEPYIFDETTWKASKAWKPYRPKKKAP